VQSADAQVADPTALAIGDQIDLSVPGNPAASVPLSQKPGARAASAPIGSRSENPDGAVAITAGETAADLPLDAKVGVVWLRPRRCQNAVPDQARDRGARWTNVAVPGAPVGLHKTTIDARVDRAAELVRD
jgi:hypothetical protein